MRFRDPRVQVLLATLLAFRLLPGGFANREFREHVEPLLEPLPGNGAPPPRRPGLLPCTPPELGLLVRRFDCDIERPWEGRKSPREKICSTVQMRTAQER